MDGDFLGLSDPFVVVEIGYSREKTTVQWKVIFSWDVTNVLLTKVRR